MKNRLTTLALSACAGLLLLPAAGQAATTFGSRLDHEPANSGECVELGPCTIAAFIQPQGPGDMYSGGAPVDGVITEFRIRAAISEDPTQVTFRVVDLTRTAEESALATGGLTGPTVRLPPGDPEDEAPIRAFGARVPVKKGQQLAIDGTDVQATVNNSGDDFSFVYAPPLVNGAGARGSVQSTGELLVAATIEPDADKDGFGDETQDKCPTQATTQGACDLTAPTIAGLKVSGGTVSYTLSEAATVSFQLEKKLPGRKLGKKCVPQSAKNKKRKRCARFKAVGTAFAGPGSAGANTAALPKNGKLTPGAYRLTMTVRDAAGNQSTATTSFTVGKKKTAKKGR
ncbi:MAG TPA: hypothetical protein VF081_04570 [Solirubrobacterales bacterium]